MDEIKEEIQNLNITMNEIAQAMWCVVSLMCAGVKDDE